MKRTILPLLLILLFQIILYAQPLKCQIEAKSAILYNPDTRSILFAKQPDLPHHPASIMKIATALYVLDELKADLKMPCLVSKEAMKLMNASIKQADFDAYPAHILEHDGVMMGIKAGETYSLETLLYGLLLHSGNDAANVIAESCSESIESFVAGLNGYLRKRGIASTHFYNPHGLHHPNQVTTAYDMARISAWAFENQEFAKILKTASFEGEYAKTIHNKIVRSGKYKYPKSIGGKMGYTSDAGHNFVAAAEENGRRLIVVLLGCKNKDDRFKEAMTLFEAAFREKKKERLLFAKDHECFLRQIPKASGSLKGRLDKDVIISYFPSEEKELKARLCWNALELPISAGQEVGKLIIEDVTGQTIVETPLFSETGLQKSLLHRILEFSKQILIWGAVLFAIVIGLKIFKNRSKIGK
jgi:serine-type D-Ala-D-Ala carboxypeptidase (penicillin-binding protein 5/6)